MNLVDKLSSNDPLRWTLMIFVVTPAVIPMLPAVALMGIVSLFFGWTILWVLAGLIGLVGLGYWGMYGNGRFAYPGVIRPALDLGILALAPATTLLSLGTWWYLLPTCVLMLAFLLARATLERTQEFRTEGERVRALAWRWVIRGTALLSVVALVALKMRG